MNIDPQSNSSTDDPQATEDLQAGVIRAIYAYREQDGYWTDVAEQHPASGRVGSPAQRDRNPDSSGR